MDHNVIRNAIERRSQVIGISAYASMSLFVDLLLGLKRHHIDVFHTIDNRFDKVQSTKSLLLSYISSLVDLTTFTTGDYLEDQNAENNLKQIFVRYSITSVWWSNVFFMQKKISGSIF